MSFFVFMGLENVILLYMGQQILYKGCRYFLYNGFKLWTFFGKGSHIWDIFCIKRDTFCIKGDKFCIKGDTFCIGGHILTILDIFISRFGIFFIGGSNFGHFCIKE